MIRLPMLWVAYNGEHILFNINTDKTISPVTAAAAYKERKECKEEDERLLRLWSLCPEMDALIETVYDQK